MADVLQKDNAVHEAIHNITISRGLRPELEFEFSKVESLYVYNETGNKIRFGDIYKKQKTIIVFVRVSYNFYKTVLFSITKEGKKCGVFII